jgi:uncharacterized protein (TIGR02466 family)
MLSNLKFIFPIPVYEHVGKIEEIFLVNKEIQDNLPLILSNDNFSNPEGWSDGVITNIKHRYNTIEDYKLLRLKKFIEQHVKNYIAQSEANCPVPVYLTHSWINFTSKNQGQDWHQHDDSIISGVYYYSTNEIDGDLVFKTPNPFVNIEFFPNGPLVKKYYSLSPKKGKLILFPGWLEHKVEVNQTDHQRISISFNFYRDNLFKSNQQ